MPDERFIDEYAPCSIYQYGCIGVPTFFNQITINAGRRESLYARGEDSLQVFTIPSAVRKYEDYVALAAHWYAMRGTRYVWPLIDPLDFASHGQAQPYKSEDVPTISTATQIIGTGDGIETDFQLVKHYTRGAQSYARPIYLPVLSSVIVTVDDVVQDGASSPAAYEVSRPGGIVSFAAAPAEGAVIRAGFLFDVAVRFESDDTFGGIVRNWRTAGNTDLTLIEVRLCED